MTTQHQTALVTGASSGIGAVYARRLAARGYDLVLVARRADRLGALAEELRAAHGVTVDVLAADLTSEADLVRVEDLLRSRDVTLLVNNAGNGSIARTPDLTDAQASSTLALNVTALVRLSRAAIPGMLAHGRGIIVNVGSVMAFGVVPVSSLYNATKSFVLTFSRGLAEELDGTGIHVQAVLPAGTTTEFYDAAGIPMSSFDQSVFMSAEALVDAALVGLDRRETVTLPSVEELSLWEAFDEARAHLFAGTQIGQPASRYRQ